MARRHSLQNPLTSPGPPPSVLEPVLCLKDEPRGELGTTSGRKRSSSVAGFFTKFLPSHRPERSGTLRDQGFWEEQQTDHSRTDHRVGPSYKHGSDSIISNAWNPSFPLPENTQRAQASRLEGQPLLRVQSQPIGSRPHSLTPHRYRPRDPGRQQDSQPSNATKKTHRTAEVAASVVSRRPSDPGPTTANAIQRLVTTFDAKREARRLRRSLKESSDFLGVQGINPHTGVMDILTPTSSSPTDRTMMSAPEPQGYSESMSDSRAAYQRAARTRDAEEASLGRLRKEQDRLDKVQRNKESIRSFQHRVRWRKDRNQWSSVAEPDLSPIADASTRSRTSRSTSDGAIIPPPAIPKVLRWEEQRSISIPTGLQTGLSTPQTRPDIVAQESSDTIIHTPHPEGDRRHSVITDILGNGINRTLPQAIRRASEPGPAVEVATPGLSASNRRIYRKPVPPPKDKQKPPSLKITIPGNVENTSNPGPSIHQDSFLGARIETKEASYHYTGDRAITNPSLPAEIGQEENRRFAGPVNMDETPIGSPPDAAICSLAGERNRKVWFVNYPSSPNSSPRKRPSIDKGRGVTSAATATTPQSQPGTIHVYRGPSIPLPLGPKQEDTRLVSSSQIQDTPVNLTDTEISPKTKDPQTSGWAKQLLEDIAGFGQDTKNLPPTAEHETKIARPTGAVETRQESPPEDSRTQAPPKSAYIPTTTITGYDPRLLVHTRGLHRRPYFDGPAESSVSKDDRVTRISAMEAATKLQLKKAREKASSKESRDSQVSTTQLIDAEVKLERETATDQPAQKPWTSSSSFQQPTQPDFDLLASPPRLPPSVWPSLDISAPRQRQHRIPMVTEYRHQWRRSEPKTETVHYKAEPGLANGIISSHKHLPTKGCRNGSSLWIPQNTAPIYTQEPGPIIPTTSASQLVATRERCERLYRRISRLHPKGPDREAAMTGDVVPIPAERCNNGHGIKETPATAPSRNAGVTNLMPYKHAVTTASPTSTSTCHASVPKYRYMPSRSPSSSGNTSPRSGQPIVQPALDGHQNHNDQSQSRKHLPIREPATEAARTALVGTQYNAATARIVHVPPRKGSVKGNMTGTPATPTAAAWGPDGLRDQKGRGSGEALPDDSADTDGPSGKTRTDKVTRATRIALKGPRVGAATALRYKSSGLSDTLVKVMSAYWNFIAPVFDAGSPISKRFSAGRSTWHDCAVYLLALVFVLVAFLAAVWGIKWMLLVAGLARAVLRGAMVLVGF